jgi:ABC-type uncharacterized transport system permease subunit
MSLLGAMTSKTMIAATITMTVPYACAALGGVLSERSGVVNVALEGTLLCSALAAVAAQLSTGSVALSVLAAMLCGACVGFVHALLVVRGRVDGVVSGLSLNLVAAGGTRLLLRALYGSSSNSPSARGLGLGDSLGPLTRALLDPFVWATLAITIFIAWGLQQTRFGLHLRASGEDPEAARVVGVDVVAVRTRAVTLGGAVCGLGGAALAFELHQFQAGMSGGRGFIALAAVILAGWQPGRAVLACIAFSALDAAQIVLQSETHWPPQLFAMLPYGATLVTLAVVSTRSRRGAGTPAGLGKHASV